MALPRPRGLDQRYDIQETADWILQGSYKRVALQFPDDQLADSPAVYAALQERVAPQARVRHFPVSPLPGSAVSACRRVIYL
jgi:diphthamide synthase subunit DPH2